MNTCCRVSVWQWQSGSDYLAHHGILGQKWGKRNGPPYPLSAGAHSSAEKRLKSKNDGKLESWRSKEVAEANKKYDRALDKNAVKSIKLSRKITKDVNDRKFAKYSAKADKLIEQHEALKKAKAKEIDTVMQMSLEDAKAEKAYVGKRIAAKLLLTAIPLPMVLSEAEWDKTRFRNDEIQKRYSKEIDKAKKDAEKDFMVVRSYLPGSHMLPRSERDEYTYAKRHSDLGTSVTQRAISKKGGAKVSDRYAEEYEYTRQRMLDYAKRTGFRDSDLAKLEKFTKPKFRVNPSVTSLAENYAKDRDRHIQSAKVVAGKPGIAQKAKALRNRGLTYYEIADELGIADGTVYALINEKI